MNDFLTPVGVLATIAAGIGYFTKVLTDYKLRKKLIENKLVNPDAANILNDQELDGRYASLKWGLIILFAGIGLILINMVDFYRDSPLPFGIMAVSIALGFLTYFFVVKNKS